MPGLGTIINVAAIIAGGLIGISFGKIMPKHVQEALVTVCGIATIFLGIFGAVEKSLTASFVTGAPDTANASAAASTINATSLPSITISTTGSMMMILSLIIGALIGELIGIEKYIEKFGTWLKRKTGSESDASFVNGFVTASLTVCIGAMAIVGSIEDGIYGNHSILMAKAVLDFVIIVAMAASLGKGALFSFISVGILQGTITLLSRLIAPIMTDAAMNNLSLVGNVLIFCVGLNLVFGKKVRVGNLLPSLAVAVIWAFLPI